MIMLFYALFIPLALATQLTKNPQSPLSNPIKSPYVLAPAKPEDKCPPCFNCMLPIFECKQFSTCNEFTGQCECAPGFGGPDCLEPVCGALSDGTLRPIRGNATSCECKDGWEGINCNVCNKDSVCDLFVPPGLTGTCYREGLVVNQMHLMCDVTNAKIVAILEGKKPQVTFLCNKTAESCNFQFWIAQKESFYCDLEKCALEYDLALNKSHYRCADVMCKCLPGRMLCGENGLIDILDFLTETIQGPGDFSCDVAEKTCSFSEPSMNDLILSVFGDPYITLKCTNGECVHYSEIPGYNSPEKSPLLWHGIALLSAVVIGIFCLAIVCVSYIRRLPLFDDASSNDASSEEHLTNSTFLALHVPATLTFEEVGYSVAGKSVLRGAAGIVRPRETLAIMGGSGAGKTTLLDLLAGKNKSGEVVGLVKINGQHLTPKEYRRVVGFVDQEDVLMPTLTVYETVLNLALLRLPRTMLVASKKARVMEVLDELRILKIRDRLVGLELARGILGGEKRRVAIACELVTLPLVLFLDEPTSGLDLYNARKVVECLVSLARNYNRTVVFTIHQPQSSVVALFDKLLLLDEGNVVYSGSMMRCAEFFSDKGFPCPSNYNIADYLIDLTSEKSKSSSGHHDHSHDVNEILTRRDSEVDTQDEWAHFAAHREELLTTLARDGEPPKRVVSSLFVDSSDWEQLMAEIAEVDAEFGADGQLKPALLSQGFESASMWLQILILLLRTFKNVYRNPRLLMTQYLLSVFMGCFVGTLYYDISLDIGGFQNRMGLFFFILSFFGFLTLTGLHSFLIERIIYVRERSNNYFHSFSYYVTRILCDVLPLRVLPPVIVLAITYPLVGLNMENNGFLKAVLILVLFNLATSLEVLVIGIVVPESGNATLLGVLILLFSMLFSGLFINVNRGESQSLATEWTWVDLNVLRYFSVFHYGYEALIVNEVNSLVLRETKYGLKIEVPGATILSTFGFKVAAFWADIWLLVGFIAAFLALGYLCLWWFVVEKR